MTTLEIKLNLPDELALQAQTAGLLTPQAIELMLRALWARLPREELTTEIAQEIVAEVRAYRAEKRNKAAN